MSKIYFNDKEVNFIDLDIDINIIKEGDTLHITHLPKPVKPLLADASVGDLVELRSGMVKGIWKVSPEHKLLSSGILYPIYTNEFCYQINGSIMPNHKEDAIDIIRLIPKHSAEWAWEMNKLGKEVLHPDKPNIVLYTLSDPTGCICPLIKCKNKEVFMQSAPKSGWQIYDPAQALLDKYPNIERDLSGVEIGDTVLFSNGKVRIVDLLTEKYFNVERDVDVFATTNFDYRTGEHKYGHTAVTCLGIIKRARDREYSLTEINELLVSGKLLWAVCKEKKDDKSYHFSIDGDGFYAFADGSDVIMDKQLFTDTYLPVEWAKDAK